MSRDPRSLNDNIIFLAGEVAHGFHRALTKAFKANRIAVTVEQFSILVLLFYRNGLNQQEVSEQLGRDKTTVARVVVNMEKRGLLERRTDPDDNRGRRIFLTPAGLKFQRHAVEVSGALYHRAIGKLRMTRLQTTAHTLRMILKNIS